MGFHCQNLNHFESGFKVYDSRWFGLCTIKGRELKGRFFMTKQAAIEQLKSVIVFVDSYLNELRMECDKDNELYDVYFHHFDSLAELSSNIGNAISGISILIPEK